MTEECIRGCKSTICAYSPHCITPLERNDFCYLTPTKWKQIQEKMEKKRMTEDKCKYKFQDKDKFNGKEYCTLFNEVCENVSFVCDKNCQIYDDYKQLQELKQENEILRKTKSKLLADLHETNDVCNAWEKEVNNLRYALEEINLILDELKQQYDYMTDYSEIKEIQDKINECLGE